MVKDGQTIQEELERKSNRDHTHAFGGGAPEVTPEMVGKYLGVNRRWDRHRMEELGRRSVYGLVKRHHFFKMI